MNTFNVQAWLDQLPNHPDEIAARLHAAGARGVPGEFDRCVVAQHLRQQTGRDLDVSSLHRVIGEGPPSSPERSEWEMPGALVEFVNSFDVREYPELIEIGQ